MKSFILMTVLMLLTATVALAGNGGNIFQPPKDPLQLNKEAAARKAEDARKKTEALNKKWRAQLRKEAKAKAKAKAKAEADKKKRERTPVVEQEG